jgi:hypothetical protein
MEKGKLQVIGSATFFAEIEAEADRLGRSTGWLLETCLKRALPELQSLAAGSDSLEKMKKSPIRDPLIGSALKANIKRADELGELPAAPEGADSRVYFFKHDLYASFNIEGERLRLTTDEILMFAWELMRETLRSWPDAEPE